jgi:hypothetical protein
MPTHQRSSRFTGQGLWEIEGLCYWDTLCPLVFMDRGNFHTLMAGFALPEHRMLLLGGLSGAPAITILEEGGCSQQPLGESHGVSPKSPSTPRVCEEAYEGSSAPHLRI